MRLMACGVVLAMLCGVSAIAADNKLTKEEKAEGWILLFNGKNLKGWTTSRLREPRVNPVRDGMINPRRIGAYLLITEEQYGNFVLKLDFKLPPEGNSGVFLRTNPLMPKKDFEMWENAIEVQLLDGDTTTVHDTGAFYDLVAPSKNNLKRGEWNTIEIRCDGSLMSAKLNGELVSEIDLDEYTEPYRRPDGTEHKFKAAFKDHPRRGHIGLQDHGDETWIKNIKLLPLD